MRVCLQRRLTNVYVQKTRSHVTCVFSGDYIPKGEHAVTISNRNYNVWLSLQHVDDFCRELTNHDPDDPSPDSNRVARPNSRDNQTKHVQTRERTLSCSACGERMSHGDSAYYLTRSHGASDRVYVHEECDEKLCETVQRVWNHADELLTGEL